MNAFEPHPTTGQPIGLAGGQDRRGAAPPKADIAGRQLDVRFVPKADIAYLFDHLVGAGEKCRWNFEAERFRRLQMARG